MPYERLNSLLFPWETLEAIIGGRSAIDVPRLQVYNEQEATDFLRNYGFDFHLEAHRKEIKILREMAIQFVEEALINDEPHLTVPEPIRDVEDTRELLIWASRRDKSVLQRWSCSVLRIMHTLAHGPSYFATRFGEQIRSQVLARFSAHIFDGEDGMTLGMGEEGIPLVHFNVKKTKHPHSVTVKLLHKPENVAADVFDHIGVRFVTRDRLDALLVVKYLRENNVFMFANVKPSRSRNTLIDTDWLRKQTKNILSQHESLSAEELDTPESHLRERHQIRALRLALEALPYPAPPERSSNPYSSRRYNSIQFTCRQMIRVANPYLTSVTTKLSDYDTAVPNMAVRTLLQDLHKEEEIRFFFPFEVQIMDQISYEQSRSGEAAHDQYKARQRNAVKQRVLGTLLTEGNLPESPEQALDVEEHPVTNSSEISV